MLINKILSFFLALGIRSICFDYSRGGAQALDKEFPASAPWVIQGAIKFPQSYGYKGAVATRTEDVRVYGLP